MEHSRQPARKQTVLVMAVVMAAIAAGAVNHWYLAEKAKGSVYWQHEMVLGPIEADPSDPRPDDEMLTQAALEEMFTVDGQGQLIIDHDTKSALDALWWNWLSDAESGLPLEIVQKKLKVAVPGEAGERASDLLASYQGYQLELAAGALSSAQQDSDAELEQQLQRQLVVRQRHFDSVTAGMLFGAEDRYLRYLLAAMKLEADETLSARQKEALLQELHKQFAGSAAPGS